MSANADEIRGIGDYVAGLSPSPFNARAFSRDMQSLADALEVVQELRDSWEHVIEAAGRVQRGDWTPDTLLTALSKGPKP